MDGKLAFIPILNNFLTNQRMNESPFTELKLKSGGLKSCLAYRYSGLISN